MVTQLRAISIVDALAAALRERIFNGELGPGALLPEGPVAADYEVARPTAKAAIEKLVSEGLLRRDAHKTARVPVMTASDVYDLYFSRACIEREAMRLLAVNRRVPEVALVALEEIVAAGSTSTVRIVAPDVRFHEALVEALDSPRLRRTHTSLMAEVRLAMVQIQSHGLLPASDIAAEHRVILDRIQAGDATGAAEAVDVHLERARDRLMAHVGADLEQASAAGTLPGASPCVEYLDQGALTGEASLPRDWSARGTSHVRLQEPARDIGSA